MLSVRLLFLSNIDSMCFSLPLPAMTKLIKGVLFWRWNAFSIPTSWKSSICLLKVLISADGHGFRRNLTIIAFLWWHRKYIDYYCFKKLISVKHLSVSLTATSPWRGKLYSRIPISLWEKLWNCKICGSCNPPQLHYWVSEETLRKRVAALRVCEVIWKGT